MKTLYFTLEFIVDGLTYIFDFRTYKMCLIHFYVLASHGFNHRAYSWCHILDILYCERVTGEEDSYLQTRIKIVEKLVRKSQSFISMVPVK